MSFEEMLAALDKAAAELDTGRQEQTLRSLLDVVRALIPYDKNDMRNPG